LAEVGLRWWRRDAAITERRISMSRATKPKSAEKRSRTLSATPVTTPKPAAHTAGDPKSKTADAGSKLVRAGSKQARVIAMLHSPAGATIAAMMKATDWQQHSVRGFLAGVVRKRLKLKLGSKKVDGVRVYQIADVDGGRPSPRRSRLRSS
jgi:hypothetical protein